MQLKSHRQCFLHETPESQRLQQMQLKCQIVKFGARIDVELDLHPLCMSFTTFLSLRVCLSYNLYLHRANTTHLCQQPKQTHASFNAKCSFLAAVACLSYRHLHHRTHMHVNLTRQSLGNGATHSQFLLKTHVILFLSPATVKRTHTQLIVHSLISIANCPSQFFIVFTFSANCIYFFFFMYYFMF